MAEEKIESILEEPVPVPAPAPKPELVEAKPKEAKEKPAERVLPKEIHELPERFEQLAREFGEFKTSIQRTIEPLLKLVPPETEPCPGCGTPVPKEKVEEIRKKLEEKAPVKEVIREVPRVEVKEVPKEVPSVPLETFRKTLHEIWPERPKNEIVEAFEKFKEAAKKAGWLK